MNSLKYKIFIIVFFSFFLISSILLGKMDIPSNNLFIPVLIKFPNQGCASGFFLHDDLDVYFVTASHVLFDKNNKSLKNQTATLIYYSGDPNNPDKIRMELNLKTLLDDNLIKRHSTQDIAVIKIGLIEGGKFGFFPHMVEIKEGKNLLTYFIDVKMAKILEEVLVSNEIYIFGYPSSLGIKNLPQIDYEAPLLRKGIVAGKNNIKKTIIVDCPTYSGNSGSPVWEIEKIPPNITKYSIIGLVSEFIPFVDRLIINTHGSSYPEVSNSGYSVVIPMDAVLELMSKER